MWFRHVRTWVRRAVLAVLGLQALTLAGLFVADHRRKQDRSPVVFPKADPTPVRAGGTDVVVYTYGQDVFDAMLEAIEGAQERIFLETYIWKGDATGRAFRRALNEAAERGVAVYLVWDEFANLVVPPKFYRFHPDVKILRHPLIDMVWDWWHPRNWGRNHRKLLTIDGDIGFIGGYNIGTLYATDWRDTHVRIDGDAVAELDNAFIDYWNLRPSPRRPVLTDGRRRDFFSRIKVQRNVPKLGVFPIRYMYLEAIDRATDRIWLTHAYLIPDEDLTRALVQAARRGVDVRIIVPERSNHIVADWVSRGGYRELLAGGVRLFLYQGAMVHSKTALVDDAWTTVGTANLDRLSLAGNYEINLDITDSDMAEKMAEVFELDLTNCRELTLAEWTSRHWMMKFSEGVLKPLRPLL
ncbi:phospholipase D-like domain-containing protein [Mariniluteicoccus endophyticus]